MTTLDSETGSRNTARRMPPGTTILLIAGGVLIVYAALYNEHIVGLFVSDLPLIARAIPRIRSSEADFLKWGCVLVVFSLAVHYVPVLDRLVRHHVVATVILAGTSIALPVTILELTLRPFAYLPGRATNVFMKDDDLGWKLRPHARGRTSGIDVSINGKGLRGREVPDARIPNRRRILFIGDSVTFGFGVEEQQTLPAVVESLLNTTSPESTETVNGGVTGYSSWQELEWLSKEGVRYDPDVIVLTFVLNDVTDWLSLRKFGGWDEGVRFINTSLVDELATTSNIMYFVRMVGAKIRFGKLFQEGALREEQLYVGHLAYFPDRPDVRDAWRRTLEVVDKVVALCRERSVPLVLVVFPYTFQLDNPASLSAPQGVLGDYAAHRGLPFVDLLPVFDSRMRSSGEPPTAFFLDDLHPTARGDSVAADTLVRLIRARNLLRD